MKIRDKLSLKFRDKRGRVVSLTEENGRDTIMLLQKEVYVKNLVFAFALAFGTAMAAEPDWPSDFWTVFSNRVTTARAEFVTTTTPQAATLGTPLCVDAPFGPFGDEEEPFDSRAYTFMSAAGFNFNSFPPTGFLLFLR